MQGSHPNQAALSHLATGRLRGRPLVALLEHLSGCPQCGSLFGRAALDAGGDGDPVPAPEARELAHAGYARALDQVARRVRRIATRLERERSAAAGGIAHLAALPERERRRAVLTEPRLQTYAVAREALALSARSRTDDAIVAEELAGLALVVVKTLTSRQYGRAVLADLRCETWAAIGNARRIRSDLRRAGTAFEAAHGHAEEGTGDPLETAELATLYATYLRDASRLGDAREHYDLACHLYHDLGDRHLEGRTLISKAILESEAGRPEEALRLTERAPRLLDPAREPRLGEAVRQNRAMLLAELGHPERALRSLDGVFAGAGAGRLDRLRALWLRARLLERLGRREDAHRALLVARTGFERAAIPVDVALLDLDLCRLCLEDGDRERARDLAAGAFPVFAAQHLAPHTIRALELFRAAGA